MSPLGRIFGHGRAIENLLKKAEESFGKGEWENCAHFVSDVRGKIKPDNPGKFANELLRAYYLEAAAYFKINRIDASLDVIEEAFKQPQGLADVAKLLSEIAAVNADDRVIKLLEQVIKKLPDNNFVALALAYHYVDIEKFDDEALTLFRKINQRAPDNSKVIYGLARSLHNQKKYDRTSLAIYRRAFHDYSTNDEILFALAKTYASQTPPVSEALPVIERALKFFPDEKSFQVAKIHILADLPSLLADQVKILLEHYKKTKDSSLANKLVNHLLAAHADDEDACRVYETVWEDHPKMTTLLSILAERYRLAGRRDPEAVEIFQAFFDEMPRERENTLYLARRYAEKKQKSQEAILVYQQALRDNAGMELNDVTLALADAYLASKQKNEESARVYRLAHAIAPEDYTYLEALKGVALAGGRMDGNRADPLIEYIKHSGTSEKDAQKLSQKLGQVLANEKRNDTAACEVYRLNVEKKWASDREEDLLVAALVRDDAAKIRDIPLLERVYERDESDHLASVLSNIYRETGDPSEKWLPIVIRALKSDPSNKKLAGWALGYLLNQHGQDDKYFPLFTELIARGYLASAKNLRSGVVASTATRIARDLIREQNFKEAISVLSEAFKVDKTAIIQTLLGVSYQGSGDYQTGLGVFKDLQKGDKQNPAFSYRIGVLKLLSGDVRSAEKEFKALEKIHPKHPMVHLRLGMVLETNGQSDAALEEYTKVKSGDKAVVAFADYRKGIILCSQGEYAKGLKLLERASGGGVVSEDLDSAVLLARLTLADADIGGLALDAAERRLMKLCETTRAPWTMAVVERIFRLAVIHLQQGHDKIARRVLEVAARTGIRDARVASMLSMLDINEGRPKAAIERMENVLGLRDKAGAELAHRIWSIISLRLGKLEDARNAADWLIANKSPDGPRMRFLNVWRDPLAVDWPVALENFTYDDLEVDLGFPVGLIGRMAYKRADYEGGAKYLEKYIKDKKRPDRVEAEFLLGLMYIKLKKPNLGLHYWSQILSEGHRELSGKQRIDGLMLLGLHFMEHGETEKSREAFKLAQAAGSSDEEIQAAVAYSHLQAGYLQAKVDNMLGAIREWEKILEDNPDHWQALQNLGIAYFWNGDDDKAMDYFDRLYIICEDNPDAIDPESVTFVTEETRKMINQLVAMKQAEKARTDVKREMLLDDIMAANRHYWTLNVKKGVSTEEAQANYFRLIKIYNPEKYPRDFMVLEKAYDFFNKPGLLKKNEQLVFNAFHFRQLSMEEAGGLSEIPPSPQVVDYLKHELDPKNHVNFTELFELSLARKEKLPVVSTTPDLTVADYLSSW